MNAFYGTYLIVQVERSWKYSDERDFRLRAFAAVNIQRVANFDHLGSPRDTNRRLQV